MKTASDNITTPQTVGELTAALFVLFPAADAQADDRTGLQVGDPAAPVSRVGVALDPTVELVNVAATLGCQALVCHHPAYWFAPREFVAAGNSALLGGATAFAAARAGVALIALHTNLDAAPSAREMLLGAIGYRYAGPLLLTNAEEDAALAARDPQAQVASIGQLAVFDPTWDAPAAFASAPAAGIFGGLQPETAPSPAATLRSPLSPPTLEELALRCIQAFSALAKVWGDPAAAIARLAVCSGAGSELLAEVVASGADCFLTGELRHHEAIALAGQGIAVIELGHDISELPYRVHIAQALSDVGFAEADIVVLEPSASWWTPQCRPAPGDAAVFAASTNAATTNAASANAASAKHPGAPAAGKRPVFSAASFANDVGPGARLGVRAGKSPGSTVLTFADLEEISDV